MIILLMVIIIVIVVEGNHQRREQLAAQSMPSQGRVFTCALLLFFSAFHHFRLADCNSCENSGAALHANRSLLHRRRHSFSAKAAWRRQWERERVLLQARVAASEGAAFIRNLLLWCRPTSERTNETID